MFISYQRSDSAEVELIEEALSLVGIPAWRDTTKLRYGNTPNELLQVITDQTIAGGILYITPQVRNSAYVLDLEAPALIKRALADPDFFVVPIASGGLSYSEASSLFDGHLGAASVSTFNMVRCATPLTPEAADAIAKRVLAERVRRIGADSSEAAILFTTRKALGFSTANALTVDHQSGYLPTCRDTLKWVRSLRCLEVIVSAFETDASHSSLQLSGFIGLSYAAALGHRLSMTRGVPASWIQRNSDGTSDAWSLERHIEATYDAKFSIVNPAGTELAVLVSINDDVTPAFAKIMPSIHGLGAVVSLDARDKKMLNANDAAGIARSIARAIREARSQINSVEVVHLFVAVPAGLAFLMGQLLNTIKSVQTYEFDGVSYEPGFRLDRDFSAYTNNQ